MIKPKNLLSRYLFSERFPAADGMSYSSLKEELRRQYALSWLQETDKPVGLIAAELGYTEPSAFHRAFKKWTGTSPAAYRKNL